MNLFWTPAKEKVLRGLWGYGLSAREIGLKMGASRNAVIGKARRMGLTTTVPPAKPQPMVKPPVKVPEYTTLHAAMMGLTPESCRWVSGDPCKDIMAFCGEQALKNKPYCQKHCHIAYNNFSKPKTSTGQNR